MNDLCADIGYRSINHAGEQLCGDHVDVVEQGENSMVIVLADGLGSGVKASILSTLTSKIISTMMAEGLGLEDCVSTIAATLPVCSVRGVAYSTFSILHLIDNETAEIIQYDNPMAIWDAKSWIGIDCGCMLPETGDPWSGVLGRLACLRLDDMQVFYSEEPQYGNSKEAEMQHDG